MPLGIDGSTLEALYLENLACEFHNMARRAHQLLSIYSIPLAVTSFMIACTETPSNVSTRARSSEVASQSGGEDDDSSKIVKEAVDAMSRRSTLRGYDVLGFARTDTGYLVRLSPTRSPDPNVRTFGGGGEVFVSKGGDVRVVRLYR